MEPSEDEVDGEWEDGGLFERALIALFPHNAMVQYERGRRTVSLYWSADEDPDMAEIAEVDPGFVEAYSPAFWSDTGDITGQLHRPCPGCNRVADPGLDVPDPCLGRLPGVDSACCGHGIQKHLSRAYVSFGDRSKREKPGAVLRGDDALKWFAEHKVGPDFGPLSD